MVLKENLVIGYWQYAPLIDLHQYSRMWLSELSFSRGELKFMENLLNKHFLYLIDPKRMRNVKTVAASIQKYQEQIDDIEQKIGEHSKRLRRLVMTPNQIFEEKYRKEHGQLQIQLNEFQEAYRELKTQIFLAADRILEEEEKDRQLYLW